MNTQRDSLDDLLDRSTPPVGERVDVHAPFAAMVRDARREAAPKRAVPGWRAVVGAGLGVLLVGGASAAVAGGLFAWEPWAEDPDISYSFTLPSGIDCETRVLIDPAPAQGGDSIPTPSAGGEEFRSWAQTTDLFAAANVDARLAELQRNGGMPDDLAPAQPGEEELMVVVEPGGGLDVVPRTEAGPSPDDLYAQAVDLAVQDVLVGKSAELGLDGWWATSQQMLCGPQ